MKRRMLYLVNYDIAVPLTGAPLRSGEMVKFLSKEYEVHIISMEGCAHPPGSVEVKYHPGHSNALNSISSRMDVKFSRFGHFVFSRLLLRTAKKLMSTVEFDIIFADYASTAIYGYLLSKQYNIPWVYSSHNVEYIRFFDFAKDDFKRYFIVPYYHLIERLGCTADLFIAISEADAKVFKRWVSADRLLVIPQGFNDEVFNPFYGESPADKPIVLFFGCLTHVPNKQAVYLIVKTIVPEVVKRFPDALFQIVGSNPPKDLSHPNVEFTGFVDDLTQYIRRSNLVIAPILLGGGMRTKIIESLACGKMVISTPKGAEGISTVFNNLIIKDIGDFPEAVCKAINLHGSKNNSDFDALKNKFSWNSILPKLHLRIQDLIQ